MPTDTAVFDELHRLFGAGTFTGENSEWTRWRMVEISKIKAYRVKRNVEPDELITIARWCRAHGVWIRGHWELYRHMQDALRADKKATALTEVADLEARIQQATEIEAALPDSKWFDRLIRSAGKAREEVYEAWRKDQ